MSSKSTNVNPSPTFVPMPSSCANPPNTNCGLYGDTYEPLHPATRTVKRQIMERTISDLLVKLDYTGLRLDEARKQCRVLKSVLAIKSEEVESLTNQLFCLKKERKEIWDDYQDLHFRYLERAEEIRKSNKKP